MIKNGSKIKIPKNEANMSNKRLNKGGEYLANIQILLKCFWAFPSFGRVRLSTAIFFTLALWRNHKKGFMCQSLTQFYIQ